MTEFIRTNREKVKWRTSCAVPGCRSKSNINLNVGFHAFPKQKLRTVYIENAFGDFEKLDQHELWKRRTKIVNVKKYTKICSLHFNKEDYVLPDVAAKKRYLKKTSNPSLNLPNVDAQKQKKKVEKNNQRLNRRKNRETRKILDKEKEELKDRPLPHCEDKVNDIMCIYLVEDHCSDQSTAMEMESEPPVKHVETQVKSGDLVTNFSDFIKNDESLSTATGIPSFEMLENILSTIAISGLKEYDKKIKMHLRDRIILTFIKLKQNLSYAFLAILFNISAKYCQRIFTYTITLLKTFHLLIIKERNFDKYDFTRIFQRML